MIDNNKLKKDILFLYKNDIVIRKNMQYYLKSNSTADKLNVFSAAHYIRSLTSQYNECNKLLLYKNNILRTGSNDVLKNTPLMLPTNNEILLSYFIIKCHKNINIFNYNSVNKYINIVVSSKNKNTLIPNLKIRNLKNELFKISNGEFDIEKIYNPIILDYDFLNINKKNILSKCFIGKYKIVDKYIFVDKNIFNIFKKAVYLSTNKDITQNDNGMVSYKENDDIVLLPSSEYIVYSYILSNSKYFDNTIKNFVDNEINRIKVN